MPSSAATREAARSRKRAQRERQRLANQEHAKAVAAQAEAIAEEMAPAQQRRNGSAIAIRRKSGDLAGFRRRDSLAEIGGLAKRQRNAAARLARDYEVGVAGAKSAGGKGISDDTPIVGRRLMALQRFRAAMDALGPTMAVVVILVVLANESLAALAARLKTDTRRASGQLSAALDRLADHYAPPQTPNAQGTPGWAVVMAAITAQREVASWDSLGMPPVIPAAARATILSQKGLDTLA